MLEFDKIWVRVKYESILISSHHSDEKYGEWHENYSSRITEVVKVNKDEKSSYNSDIFPIKADSKVVYVVYMIYNSGDSFGVSEGNIDIIHCTSDLEAAKNLALSVRNSNDYLIKLKNEFDEDVSICNQAYGYFESIESLCVEAFSIKSENSFEKIYF